MKSNGNGQFNGMALCPSEAEITELMQLCERFRGHQIYRDASISRGVRYMAHSVTIGVRPHTIITDDLDELRDELEQSPPHELVANGDQGHSVGERQHGALLRGGRTPLPLGASR